MESIIREVKKHTPNIKVRVKEQNKVRLVVEYKSKSNYGSCGYITISAKRTDCGYSLLIEESTPSCRHYVLCSYGQEFVTTNGYGVGICVLLANIGKVKEIINKTLSSYELY